MGLFSKPKPAKVTTCMDVVDSYGATIERLASNGRQVNSSAELPFEKPLIEAALLELARRGSTSAPESTLKAGFIELSSFQDQAGTNIDWSTPPPASRAEIANFMTKVGPQLQANASEATFLAAESVRRSAEWDQRLAAIRSGNA